MMVNSVTIFFIALGLGIMFIPTAIVNNTIFPLEFIVAKKLRKNLKIKNTWKIKEVNGFTAAYIMDGWWEIYVEIVVKDKPYIWSNDWVKYKPRENKITANFWYKEEDLKK